MEKGAIMTSSMTTSGSTRNWSLILGGLLILIAGAVCVFYPGISVVTIAMVVGCALIAAGIFDFIVYFRLKGTSAHSGWTIVNAILDIVLGVLFLLNPVIAAEVITLFAGAMLICYGVFAMAMSISLRKTTDRWWLMLINGLLSILCGILMFVSPAFFAIYLGAFLMVRGATMMSFGFVSA